MKKKFIVLLKSETDSQSLAFRDFLIQRNASWWHWLSNSWLVVDPNGTLNQQVLIEAARKIYPNIHCLVTEDVSESAWIGYGPADEKLNFFSWLQENW